MQRTQVFKEIVFRTLWGILVVGTVLVSCLWRESYLLLSIGIGVLSSLELAAMYKEPWWSVVPLSAVVYVVALLRGIDSGLIVALVLTVLTTLKLNPNQSKDRFSLLVRLFACYIGLSAGSFPTLQIRLGSVEPLIVFWLAIWIFDSTAYLWGRFLGQEKFAPFISPGKNLEGFVFGYITTVLGCVLLSVWLKEPLFNVFGIVIPLAGISGDLLESWAKRVVGVKDSGKLIPYHGGVWDRFDSSLLASLAVLVTVKWL